MKVKVNVGFILKETELKIIAELLKNARASDREISKRIGISQPTVSRTRVKLEKEGMIRTYTVIPDFIKLGYKLAALTFAKMEEIPSKEVYDRVREQAREAERKNPSPVIASFRGEGIDSDYMSFSFHKTYSEYSKYLDFIKRFPQLKSESFRSFLIDLTNREHFRFLTLSVFADYLLRTEDTT